VSGTRSIDFSDLVPRTRGDAIKILALAVVYAVVASFGQSMALVSTETAFGWFASGIALGAVTAFGLVSPWEHLLFLFTAAFQWGRLFSLL
jgi:integral membrane sensor domain MASE1